MDMYGLAFPVQDGGKGVLIRIEASKSGLFVIVQDLLQLRLRRPLFRPPGYHAAGVAVLEVERVGHRRNLIRIAIEHPHLVTHLAVRIRLPGQILGGTFPAPGSVS